MGKSTLLNALIGQNVSAVSVKPNTTRCSVLGVRTMDNVQFVFYDTPGISSASYFNCGCLSHNQHSESIREASR